MIRVVCSLPVDPVRHAGCCDKVDQKTGQVLQTAEQAMIELAAKYPRLRPCCRETDFLHGGWVEKYCCKRCKNCKKWWEESEDN